MKMFLNKGIQKKECKGFAGEIISLFIILCFFWSNTQVFAEDTCPGPTEGRTGGTDPAFKIYQPDGTPYGQPQAGILFCPGSPNLLTCDNDFTYQGMDGANMAFLRPLGYPSGPLTVNCQDDNGDAHVYNIADVAVREDHACEAVEDECGVAAEDDGTAKKDLSRITVSAGGGGITLRDINRDGNEALEVEDLNLEFKLIVEDTAAAATDVCDVSVDGEKGSFTSVSNGRRTTYRFTKSGGNYCGGAGGNCEVELTNCPNDQDDKTYTFANPGDPAACPSDPGGPGRYEEGEFLWKAISESDCNLAILLPSDYTPEGAEDGDTADDIAGGGGGSGTVTNLVEIEFKGDTEVDLSFDYTNFSITAEAENVVKGTSKLLFDVSGEDGDVLSIIIKNLGVYITDGHAKDSEQLKITFNNVEYYGDNFYIDTFSEYCDGIGRFVGSTGLSGTFKIGDSMTYIPEVEYRGQDYYLDLSELDIPGLTSLGTEVKIPEGSIDKIDMTFPVIEQRRDTNAYLYTCMTSPISIDNQRSVFGEDFGSFSGQTGASNTYRIGDSLVYHGPYQVDEDKYTIDLEVIGKSKTEASETGITIDDKVAIDNAELATNVTATDNAGNEVVFEAPLISIDTIRPEFEPNTFISDGKFIELFIPQEKLNDPRYKGFQEKFGIGKSIWGDGDHLKVLMPTNDLKDEGAPLVSVDFSDISTAGNLLYLGAGSGLEIELDKYYNGLYTDVSEIAGYVDEAVYSKVIKYTDDAGNQPEDVDELKTNEVAIDMVGPQIPNPPPSYSVLEIMVNRLIATIGTAMKLKTPAEDARAESLRFSTNLMEIGGSVAEFLFEQGDVEFTIEAGEVQAGEDYNRVIYYFDKAFNLLEREIDKILVDNKVATFDTACGATFQIIDKNLNWGDFNQIADITNNEADELIFTAPNNSIEGCDLSTFSIDFTPISEKKDLVDVYEQIPADGRQIFIEVGQGTLDDVTKQLVLKAHDQYGNTHDYLTGAFNVDNEITTRQLLTDKIEFADFNTEEEIMYVGAGDNIRMELVIASMKDIKSVVVKIEGGMAEYELTQDPRSLDDIINNIPNQNPWRGVAGISSGDFEVEPKYITFVITDDAGNVVVLEGNQKIYVSNKVPDFSGSDGGTENLHRDGFSGGIPLRGRGDYLREKEEFDRDKIAEYMNEAEKFENKIKFLLEHGFELGPEEKAYMKARSLNRRLNYLEPKINKNHKKDVPSYWELLKDKLKISRKNIIKKQTEPRKMEKKIRKLVDPRKEVKNWNELVDREGGLHTQNTLNNLKNSARRREPKFSQPGTLRKSELFLRGIIGSIK